MLSLPPGAVEDMEFRVELWDARGAIERVLAMAVSVGIARGAYAAAVEAYPGREVTLRLGIQVILSTRE